MANIKLDRGRANPTSPQPIIRQIAPNLYQIQSVYRPKVFYTVTIHPGGEDACNCFDGLRGECTQHIEAVNR